MTRYIQDYIELVRSGTVPVCRDQLLLVDYVERVFQEESIYVDEAQLERYMDQQKYFPYRLLEWRIRIDMTHVRVVDIFDVAVKLDKLIQDAVRLYHIAIL